MLGPMSGAWIVFPLVGLTMMIVMVVMVTTMLRNSEQGSARGWTPGPWVRGGDRDDDSALEVLARRYAAGELSDDEFQRRRTALVGRR
jgi:uncharacterized membrane protein